MRWSINPPKKYGWYLVTLTDGTVMPMYRQEYPPKYFSWQGVACGAEVMASIKFPAPYRKEERHV